MAKILIETVTSLENNFRLDKWIHHRELNIPFSHIQKLCRSGQVRVNSKRKKSSYRLKAGDIVRFPIFEKEKKTIPTPPKYTDHDWSMVNQLIAGILFQNDHYVILNKPSGLAVQGGSKITQNLVMLLPLLAQKLYLSKSSLYLPHRLDRGTSGLILLGKSSLASKEISEAFKNKRIKKKYLAICEGHPSPPSGTVEMYLAKDKKNNSNRRMHQDRKNGKYALTHYTCLKNNSSNLSIIELTPITGRSHQLRTACQSIGCPILGDKTYNPDSLIKAPYLLLHAWKIQWPEKQLNIEAPFPPHFQKHALV